MQSENEDRRASHVRRVELETLVEICGRDQAVPPFEAQSVEISGRGMQVRTQFLPDLHAPLVLRFEHDGHEVLVEGEVAWRKGDDKGGQFGIKFTALDSKSVAALKALSVRAAAAQASEEASGDASDPAAPVLSERGAPVKLHIQGLGAPMKARVFRGSARKLEVGSQLEFLKVGKSLELEDVSAGQRRAAHIDGVTVAIDAQSQIPQLVVSLRYEGVEDDTPAPTVLGSRKDKVKARAKSDDEESSESDSDEGYEDEDEDEEYTEDIFKGKVGALAASAGRAVKNGSVQVATWSTQAVGGFGDLVRSVSSKLSSGKPRSTTPRRTSRPPQSGLPRQQSRRAEALRPQQAARKNAEESRPSRGLKPVIYAGALAACVWGTYTWLGHAADQQSPSALRDDAELNAPVAVDPRAPGGPRPAAGLPPTPETAAAQGAAAAEGALPDGTNPRFPKPAALSAQQQLQASNRGIVAQVPLFGPTEMATSEGAPVNPPPRSEVIDEYSLAKDQVFGEERVPAQRMPEIPGARAPRAPASMAVSEQAPAKTPTEAVETGSESFQVGRMNLPVVYRLRLDGAATTLQGSKLATGFSVLVPGRKVMESGAAIEGRDDRIIDVRVQNTPAGGKVTFRFRKDIPGYKARLRKDYVEFFINSPEKKN